MPKSFSRRQTLSATSAAVGAFLGWWASKEEQTEGTRPTGTSLHSAALARGMRFGSAFTWRHPSPEGHVVAQPLDAALLESDCGLLVPEIEMKWPALRPSPTRFSFAAFDSMLAYAEANSCAMRGHTLLWHHPRWMPSWINGYDFGTASRARGEQLLSEHIRTVCTRYRQRIHAYDVVNEAVDPEDGGFRATPLSRAIGGADATIDLAFREARSAAGHAQLVYNDFMSWEPGGERHRAGVLRLLETFRKRGTPVDALGVQSHLVTQGPGEASFLLLQRSWQRFIDVVVAMDYKLVITELDVRDDNLPADPALRDQSVASYTRAYLDVMFDYPQLRDVLVWGMSDKYSWIQEFYPRSDGVPRRPAIYDAHFRPKPMHAAIREAFAAAPIR